MPTQFDLMKKEIDSHVQESKNVFDDYINDKCENFFSNLQVRLVKTVDDHLKIYCDKLAAQAVEIKGLRETNNILEGELLKIKKSNLEQGVHDRKRDIIISDLEVEGEPRDETQAVLEVKIRDNLVNKLDIPRAEVNKFVFTARHRLQKSRRGPPKVIAVICDLDHVNTVISAARKKGRDGQHIQNHLPQELQRWRNRCLYERKMLVDSGVQKSELRLREFKGFTKLQIKVNSEWEDKLVYKVALLDTVNFPVEFTNSQHQHPGGVH